MSVRQLPERFQVAFSLAGEQRDLVRSIAEAVEQRLGPSRVFLDEWFEPYLAGHDADLKLQKIYGHQCDLVIVCVSACYGGKPWTQTEHEAIRARLMKERESGGMLRILPIRVGDGDIEGIPFNVIIPDVRKKSIDQSAELIVERLRLVLPSQSTEKDVSSAHHNWPLEAVQFKHGLADRAVHEWPAVLRLLTSGASKRILMFEGPSGFSKSALLRAAARYAKILAVPTVYLDFKDTSFLIQINVLRELQLGLGKALPAFGAQNEPTGWTFRQALRAFQEPVLILLDTYEKAAETKELVEWIETQLLVEVEECEQLRFLIGGKKVPGTTQSRWHGWAEKVELDRIDDQRVWKEWVHELNPNVEEKHVEAFVIACQGVPADISTYLTALAQKLDGPA